MPLQSPLPLSVALAAALLCGACAQPAAPGAAAVAPAPSPVAATSAAASGRTVVPLKNPSFDPDATGRMVGWSRIEHARGKSYYFVADPENAHSAPASARITRHGPEFFGALDVSTAHRVRELAPNARVLAWVLDDVDALPRAIAEGIELGVTSELALRRVVAAAREAGRYANPIPSREVILQLLGEQGQPLDFMTLANALHLHEEMDLDALKKRLRAMERDGQLLYNRRR